MRRDVNPATAKDRSVGLFLPHRRIPHAIIVIALLVIIPPIGRERNILASRTKNTECEQKVDDTGSTVEASRKDVVILDKPVRSIPSEVELSEESDGVVHEEGTVSSMGEGSKGCADDGRVPVVEAKLWEEFVDDPKWERGGATDHEADWNPLVPAAETE